MVGDRDNAPFSVTSRAQKTCIVHFPTGGELMALGETCKEICVNRNFAEDIGFPQNNPTKLSTECNSVITMGNAPELTKQHKPYAAKVGFIRQCIAW